MISQFKIAAKPILENGKEVWPVLNGDKQVDKASTRKQAKSLAKRLNQQAEAKLPKPLSELSAIDAMRALGFQESTMTQYLQDTGSTKTVRSFDRIALSVMPEYTNIVAKTKRFIVKREGVGVVIRAWWLD